MQFLIFIIIYPFLWFVSILPFPIFYLLSDILCFFIYNVFGYRKKTVRYNLRLALNHLSDKELLKIERKFYRHMCDMFLEMIKTMTISRAEMEKRFRLTNLNVYTDLEKKGKSIAIMIAHYASYEWVISLNNHISFKGYAIYKKINNKYFDKLIKKIRLKFKANLITTEQTRKVFLKNFNKDRLSVYGFAADQSPQLRASNVWKYFMGVEVPVYTGAELLSKEYDMNVIFLNVTKVKRGFYEATFEVMTEDIQNVPEYSLTEKYLKLVENQILAQPEYYLWTHKRWKHADKNPKFNVEN